MEPQNNSNGQGEDVVYSVPEQAKRIFHEGILENSLINKDLSSDFIASAISKIKFQGSQFPSIPVNWRFAESISALKAFEGAFVNELVNKKYGLEPQEIVIDT